MSRGETKHLSDFQFRAKWRTLPTKKFDKRVPVVLEKDLLSLAQWADKQPDPEQALAKLLELAKQL